MNETAYILNTATGRSLVIMDEVGRGTGTNDGLSIAWAVSEELLNRIKCRTFFATHYHELSLISHPRMANRSMEVLDQNGEIVFLRKLRDGPASESYGIHVARLAGLAEPVLERAERIMARLRERDAKLRETLPAGNTAPAAHAAAGPPPPPEAPNPRHETMLRELAALDPDSLSPLAALQLLSGWKRGIGDETAGPAGSAPPGPPPQRPRPRRGNRVPGTESAGREPPPEYATPSLFEMD
jgi:DNA mismatch repair protein MutS